MIEDTLGLQAGGPALVVALQVCGLILDQGVRPRLLRSLVNNALSSETARELLAETVRKQIAPPTECLRCVESTLYTQLVPLPPQQFKRGLNAIILNIPPLKIIRLLLRFFCKSHASLIG
jgi:hypothetical protein